MIEHAIKTAFHKKEKREKLDIYGNWKYPMFWAIDLHDVIIPGTYTRNNDKREFYPDSKEVLQWLTNRADMCIILYTSSHKDSIADIIKWLSESKIKIDFINENPLCPNTELCDFSGKFYMDILLEDKAGFVGETDWTTIKHTLMDSKQWHFKKSHTEFNWFSKLVK